MTQWNGFNLSPIDRLRSRWNQFLFYLRNRVKFNRGSYKESKTSAEEQAEWIASLPKEEQARIQAHNRIIGEVIHSLSLTSQRRTWATLDLLSAIPETIYSNWQKTLGSQAPKLLDAGCQDFSRAPAIQSFFRSQGLAPHLTGVELDAYGILASMHSRADRANYFARLAESTKFHSGDFFTIDFPHQFDAILCFYPFVSPHPALAWGLPYEFGDASKWIQAIKKNLKKSGLAIVVHQGDWEEEEFQGALLSTKSPLTRIFSAEFQEIFEPHLHSSRISVYSSEA